MYHHRYLINGEGNQGKLKQGAEVTPAGSNTHRISTTFSPWMGEGGSCIFGNGSTTFRIKKLSTMLLTIIDLISTFSINDTQYYDN
jgi:hypothetical protein